MANFSQVPCYSPRFISALSQVAEWHKYQIRKVGNIPYVSHLMSVAALVFENGGCEDEAIAALCHDAVEDVDIPLSQIEGLFGSKVAKIVDALSEDKAISKDDRKAAYVESIANSNKSVALVSACDKLHNLRGYCRNPELVKPDIIQFYCQLYPVYKDWLDFKSLDPVHPVIKEMKDLIEEKLLRLFSVYISVDLDGDEILKIWREYRPIAIVGKYLKVATSRQIIDIAFSQEWEAMPEVLKLADGEFQKADLKSQQEALKSAPDSQLEEFYSAIGRRLN